jgi:RimJ/RimL family protein N-acetyltransferase
MPLHLPAPLQTPRLIVRPVDETDLPALQAVSGDPEVTRYLPYAPWQTPADGQAWLERMRGLQQGGAALQCVVARAADGLAIGTCLLFRFDEGSARAELGYVLGRAHWGQGLMQEALQAVLGHAFGDQGLRRVEAEVDPRNRASAALLLRLGFQQEGLRRQRWVNQGVPVDVEGFGLLRHEWLQR